MLVVSQKARRMVKEFLKDRLESSPIRIVESRG